MKTNFFYTLIALTFLFLGCNKNDINEIQESLSATTLIESINALSFEEDIDEVVTDAFNLKDNTAEITSKTIATYQDDGVYNLGPKKFRENRYGTCASINVDEENNTKTITFNGDCQGKKGQSRTGTIVITYSEIQNELGSFRQMEFVDFYMNDVKIEGTRRKEIIAIDSDGNKTTLSTLINGKMIYEDGTFSTKSSSISRFTYVENDKRIYTLIEGTSSGQSSDGVDFVMTINSPIKFSYACDFENRKHKKGKVPVEGIKTLVSGSDTIITDFGDGTCDLEAEVTKDGITETIDIQKKKRGNSFFKL